MKFNVSLIIAFFTVCMVKAQSITLSEQAEISVLTFGPGTSLNDAFGHNAFRIKDRTNRIDFVYGYGQYDFDAPNFYLKFARGKLNYLISKHKYPNIYYHYSSYDRTIEEQVLNLSVTEKQKLFNYLEHNYRPENRGYLYDFFFDNCATRIRDVVQINSDNKVNYNFDNSTQGKTFRDLIYEHVDKNTWGSFGIDIALGSVIDKEATLYEYMFLPKYISSSFENADFNKSEKLVKSSAILYQSRSTDKSSNFLFSPVLILGLFSVLIIYITYKDFKKKQRSKWLDIILFSLTGLVGLVLVLLWFATDHTATAYNYNLLWAFPFNLILLIQVFKPQTKKWVKPYLKFLLIMFCLMTMHWILGVQVFAITLIPLLLALVVRYVFLISTFEKN
ncbi:MAG: DUF4105 domain-containing protein [Winogradskyella sp.]